MIKIDDNIYDTTVNLNGVMKLVMIKFSVGILVTLNIIQNLVVKFGSYDSPIYNYYYFK